MPRSGQMSNSTRPAAGRAGAPPPGILSIVLFSVGLVCALLAAWVPPKVLPQFQSLYAGFGADLPLVTRLLLNYDTALWVVPLAVAGVGFAWRKRPRRAAAAACAIGMSALLLVILVVYLPSMTMGALV